MIIEIKAAMPVEWGKEYYMVGYTDKKVFAPCNTCDSTGKVTIKGEEFKCPRCNGNWRDKEVVSTTRVYHVEKYELNEVKTVRRGTTLRFERTDSKKGSCPDTFIVRSSQFGLMREAKYSGKGPLSDDYAAVMAEVKRLNAEVKAQSGGQNG